MGRISLGFLVLNIGLPAYESSPIGPPLIAGLFQGLAVALSIRTTNVYEERSLGVFEATPDEEDEEPADLDRIPPVRSVWGVILGVGNDLSLVK
ncbi:hypothetical protein GALMADRAFT_141681 [Galerina marginata CBS 339.88]|uniref:SLC26A/SulP transporter domain-containing protein n=1 Tax=Galerina marginata (strain CBS 339.88) TaxID=685588 RepID=A0A067SV38_GALM3|nr:hypothetical protein GALMADRAFT_141681 [Galerina marginata CBS 339.88]